MSTQQRSKIQLKKLREIAGDAFRWALLIGGTIAYHGVLVEHFAR